MKYRSETGTYIVKNEGLFYKVILFISVIMYTQKYFSGTLMKKG